MSYLGPSDPNSSNTVSSVSDGPGCASVSVSTPNVAIPDSSDNDSGGEAEPLEPAPFNDIGTLLEPTKSVDDICVAVSNPSNDEKGFYSIITFHHRIHS